MMMIHHESIYADTATETEIDSGVGVFDVVEDRDGFNVIEQGTYTTIHGSLRSAITAAKRAAATFDRSRRAANRRIKAMTDLSARNLERYGLRRGAYDGANRRRFVLFETGLSELTGEAVEVRREFDSKSERDGKALELLRIAVNRRAAR